VCYIQGSVAIGKGRDIGGKIMCLVQSWAVYFLNKMYFCKF